MLGPSKNQLESRPKTLSGSGRAEQGPNYVTLTKKEGAIGGGGPGAGATCKLRVADRTQAERRLKSSLFHRDNSVKQSDGQRPTLWKGN